jgi:hypothetical protein
MYWRHAPMLQQTFEVLERTFAEDNDACLDSAKAIVEVVCQIVIDELDDPARPIKPLFDNPQIGDWVGAAAKVLKLGDNRNRAFLTLVSQHHQLTKKLEKLRDDAGPISHGRDGFIDRLTAYHRRAAVLSADAIVAFLHQAYVESHINLAVTKEPYERFQSFNALIDQAVSMTAEIDEGGDLTVLVNLPGDEVIPITAPPSRFLYQMDRQAYIEALNAVRSATPVAVEAE